MPDQSSATVLVVDDSPLIVELISDILIAYGYSVLVANSGEEALEKLETEMPDLILLDILMPGMNGIDTCANIKDNPTTSHIPVIMLTAKKDAESHLEAMNADAEEYLTKPFSTEYLLKKVKEYIGTG